MKSSILAIAIIAVIAQQATALVQVTHTDTVGNNTQTDVFPLQNGGCYGSRGTANEFSGSVRATCSATHLNYEVFATFDCTGQTASVGSTAVSAMPLAFGSDTSVTCTSAANSANTLLVRSFDNNLNCSGSPDFYLQIASPYCHMESANVYRRFTCTGTSLNHVAYTGAGCTGNVTTNATWSAPTCQASSPDSDQFSCTSNPAASPAASPAATPAASPATSPAASPAASPAVSPTTVRAGTIVEVRSILTFNGISCATLNTPSKLSSYQAIVVAQLKIQLGVTDLALALACKKSGTLTGTLIVYATSAAAATAAQTTISSGSFGNTLVSAVNTAVASDPTLGSLGLTMTTLTATTPVITDISSVSPSPSPAAPGSSPSPSPSVGAVGSGAVPSVVTSFVVMVSCFLAMTKLQ